MLAVVLLQIYLRGNMDVTLTCIQVYTALYINGTMRAHFGTNVKGTISMAYQSSCPVHQKALHQAVLTMLQTNLRSAGWEER